MKRVRRLASLALLLSAGCAPARGPREAEAAPALAAPPTTLASVSAAPTPRRIRYVSASGGGDGGSLEGPTTLARALSGSRPGDEIRLLKGSYEGKYRVSSGGTAEHPLVIRNNPGDVPKLTGWIQVADGVPSVWIWGLEVTYPAPPAVKGDDCISIQGADNRAINNYVHDCAWNGIGAWKANHGASPGQVVYGNVIVRSDHAIYTQNRFEEDGYKSFVNDIVLDVDLAPGRRSTCCYGLHAYTEAGHVSGMDVEKGIFMSAFLMGGKHLPSDHLIVRDNLFYRSGPAIGYRRPAQVTFVGNTIARGMASFKHWWGAEEAQYRAPPPSVVTDNEFYNPPNREAQFRNMEIQTEAYVADPEHPKKYVLKSTTPHLRPDDVFDRNRYSKPPDSLNWWIGGQVQCCGGTFAQWRSAVGAAGNASFDANSSVVPLPDAPRVVVHGNDYDPRRVHVGIVNWNSTGAATIPVDLGRTLAPGTPYEVHRARDLSGPAVASGTYDGQPIPITVTGEFDAFVVISRGAPAAANR